MSDFEQKHSLALTEDYQNFLLFIGNGGAELYYGLFSLHCYHWELKDLQKDFLSRPFWRMSEGRKLEDIQKLLERLDDPDAVKAVSMNMSASFRPAVQLCFPNAQIVVDHFHVIQHVMKAFKKIVWSWAHKKEVKPLLQGKQHPFLLHKKA